MSVARSQTPRSIPAWQWGAAALALISASALLILAVRSAAAAPFSSDSVLGFFPAGDRLERAHPEGWALREWAAAATDLRPEENAFRLGVRLTDLAFALRAGDAPAARAAAASLSLHLASLGALPGNAATQLEAAMAEAPPARDRAMRAVRSLEKSLRSHELHPFVHAGQFAAVADTACFTDSISFFRSRHWAAGVELLADETFDARVRALAERLRPLSPIDKTALRSGVDEMFQTLSGPNRS